MEHIIGRLLHDCEHGKLTRRQLIQTLALTATAASAGPAQAAAPANAIYINHVSMQVADYRKTRDFYSGLFGMKVSIAIDASLSPWPGTDVRWKSESPYAQRPMTYHFVSVASGLRARSST